MPWIHARRRRPRLRTLLAFVALSLMSLAVPSAAHAQPALALGDWQLFEWFLGIGPVEGPGWRLNVAERVRVRVTDAGASGDLFTLFVDGAERLETGAVMGGVETGVLDGETAWSDARLSKGEVFLDPGNYVLTLRVRGTAPGYDFGEGFLRADLAPVNTVVPEPATIALLATGLLGVACVAARRRGGVRDARGAREAT